MDEKTRPRALETTLAQMLKPVKGIPLNLIVRSLSGHSVIRFDTDNPQDAEVLRLLTKAIRRCVADVNRNPIRRRRPNEVGNDVEDYVIRALEAIGLRPIRPTSANGHGKSTGYPDILFFDPANRPTYLECKTFAHGTNPTTMRSFYLSPSENFKVALDARHLLLAFGMEATAVPNSGDSLYRPKSYKLVDLHDLPCDVKYEFNSDNRRLYAADLMLAAGSV